MRAELDLFSGRPNPMWELSAEEEAEVTTRLSHATPCQPPAVVAARGRTPGYRGIVLTSPRRADGTRGVVRVARGIIATGRGAKRRYLADSGDLEAWLLENARARGYGALLDLL